MPDEKLPEFELNWRATDELEIQSARIGLGRMLLQKQAEIIAALDSSRESSVRDLLEAKHITQAAENLLQMLADSEHDGKKTKPVFLSYSTKDEDFARELEADLRNKGVSCFLAPLSIQPGSSWPDEIWQAIRRCHVFVLVITSDTMKSKWCLLEIGAAFGLKKSIVAVLRHSSRLPEVLKGIQAIKVQTKKQQDELVHLLKNKCSA